jgi:hypothetical protein
MLPPTPSKETDNKNTSENTPNTFTYPEIEERIDVYTAYIRGYVQLLDNTYREPTKFITLLKNAYNRGYDAKVKLRRQELLAHLSDQNITPEIIKFIRRNRAVVGEDVFIRFDEEVTTVGSV